VARPHVFSWEYVTAWESFLQTLDGETNHMIGREGRGVVVRIYHDPHNPFGSATQKLQELEWESGHLLV